MINKIELIKLLEELEQHHDEEADNHNDELLSNPDEYRRLAYERANGIRDCLMVVYEMDDIEAIPTRWLNEWYWDNSDVCCDKRVSALFGKMIRDWRIEKIRRLYGQKSATNN